MIGLLISSHCATPAIPESFVARTLRLFVPVLTTAPRLQSSAVSFMMQTETFESRVSGVSLSRVALAVPAPRFAMSLLALCHKVHYASGVVNRLLKFIILYSYEIKSAFEPQFPGDNPAEA